MRRLEYAVAALVVVAGAAFGAWALWPTRVPDDLKLRPLDERTVFDPAQLREAQHFETFLHWNSLASMIVVLIVLGLYAWRGHRLARESAAGRIGTGMLLGMLGLGILWITQVPFGLAELWWARRYGVADDVGYLEWLFTDWLSLTVEFGFICLALLIVMGFAQLLRGRWWIPGAPVFIGLYLLFAFTIPWLIPADHPMRDEALLSASREFAREQGTKPIPVRVEEVSAYTDSPNAFAAGLGVSRKVFLWDTLLDGRFADDEVRMVLAHEIAHHSREHIWKGVGWYGLFAVPGTFLIALATRRRGSLREARAVPVALFAFVALSMAAQPIFNVIGRRMESEADWVALETTADPDGARQLFVHFTEFALADPSPPAWATALFDTHPSMLDRIRMAEAWRQDSEGRSHP